MTKYTIALSDEVAQNARIAGSIIGNPNLNRFIALAVEKYATSVIETFKAVPVPAQPPVQPQAPSWKALNSTLEAVAGPGLNPTSDPKSPFDELAEPYMLGGQVGPSVVTFTVSPNEAKTVAEVAAQKAEDDRKRQEFHDVQMWAKSMGLIDRNKWFWQPEESEFFRFRDLMFKARASLAGVPVANQAPLPPGYSVLGEGIIGYKAADDTSLDLAAWDLYCLESREDRDAHCAGSRYGHDTWESLPEDLKAEFRKKAAAQG